MGKVFDNLDDLLADMQKEIDETLSDYVSFNDLFDNGFLDKNSDFSTFEAMLKTYDIKINSQQDFDDLDERLLDKIIDQSSKFSSWNEMYQTAANEYIVRKLKDNGFEIE